METEAELLEVEVEVKVETENAKALQCRTQMQLIGSKKYSNSIQIPSPPKRLKTDLAKQNAGNMIVNSWMTTVILVSQIGGGGRDAGCGA